MILTRHGSHAKWICEALRAGKSVFVEKPFALTNHSYSGHSTYSKLHSQLRTAISYGWLQSSLCSDNPGGHSHLFQGTPSFHDHSPCKCRSYSERELDSRSRRRGRQHHWRGVPLCGPYSSRYRFSTDPGLHPASQGTGEQIVPEDNVAITLTMADGSVCTINYTALGNKAFERERVEIFGGGMVCIIENFKRLTPNPIWETKTDGTLASELDKGHKAEMAHSFRSQKQDNRLQCRLKAMWQRHVPPLLPWSPSGQENRRHPSFDLGNSENVPTCSTFLRTICSPPFGNAACFQCRIFTSLSKGEVGRDFTIWCGLVWHHRCHTDHVRFCSADH